MPLRPTQTFNLIVASSVIILAAESAVLWKLSQRPRTVAPVLNPLANNNPSAPPVFTAPGVEPSRVENSPITRGNAPVTIAPSANAPVVKGSKKPPAGMPVPAIKPGAGTEKLAPQVRAQAKELFDAGSEALGRKDIKTALEKFRGVVAIAPNHIATRLNLALIYLETNQPAQAVVHLQKASQLDPKLPAPQFYLARALVALKRPAEAIAPLQAVIKLAPKERDSRDLLGRIYLQQKKPREAYAQWVAMALNDPRDIDAHLQAATLAADVLKRPQEAKKWLQLGQKGSPRDPRPALLLGRLYLAQNNAKGAATVLTQAARSRPDVFEIYPQLADARLAAGDAKGASDAIRSALLRLPSGKTAQEKTQIAQLEGELRFTLGRTLGQAKKPKEARREFERAAALLPRSAEVKSMLAIAAVQSGDRKAATAALQSAITLDPKRANDRLFLAQVLADSKNWSAANVQYEAYSKLQPRDSRALIEWASAAARAKQTDDELKIWARYATVEPRNPLPHIQRGALLRDLKRPTEALASFQRALTVSPNDPNALFETARLESKLGQYKNAANTWRKLIATRPQYTPAYASLLESSDKSGDATSARLFLAGQLAGKKENPQALSSILSFYEKKKRNSEAKAFLADVVKRNPKARFAKAALDSYGDGKPTIQVVPAPTTATVPQAEPETPSQPAPEKSE